MLLKKNQRLILLLTTLFCTMSIASGCGLLFGDGAATEPTPVDSEDRALVPTFTATPIVEQTATSIPVVELVTQSVAISTPLPAVPPTATIAPSLTVTSTVAVTAAPGTESAALCRNRCDQYAQWSWHRLWANGNSQQWPIF